MLKKGGKNRTQTEIRIPLTSFDSQGKELWKYRASPIKLQFFSCPRHEGVWGTDSIVPRILNLRRGTCVFSFMIYRFSWALWTGVCQYSSVGLATHYRLNGPGIESRWEKRFPYPSWPALMPAHPTIPYCTHCVYTGSFPGVKGSEIGVEHPPPSSADVKERVEVHLYYSSGPSWHVTGRNLHFFIR